MTDSSSPGVNQFDNVAERLHALLHAAAAQASQAANPGRGPNLGTHAFLANWLSDSDEPVDDQLVWEAVGTIRSLPERARGLVVEALGSSSRVNQRYIEPWFEGALTAARNIVNPGHNVGSALQTADAGVRQALFVTLGRLEETALTQPRVSSDVLSDWRSAIVGVREEMLTSPSLDPSAKGVLLGALDRLLQAIDLYKVGGAEGLRGAVDGVAYAVRRESVVHPPSTDRDMSAFKKLVIVLAAVAMACGGANDVVDFTGWVIDAGSSLYQEIVEDEGPAQLPPGEPAQLPPGSSAGNDQDQDQDQD